MIRIVFLAFFGAFAAAGLAQKTDFNRIVLPVDQKAKDFSEYLVQLAWLNNPANASLENRKNIAEQEVKLAKKDWLNAFGASGAYSRQPIIITRPVYGSNGQIVTFVVDQGAGDRVDIVSGGMNLNFGLLFSSSNKAEIARQRVEIAENDLDQRKLEIRAETLRRYQGFRLALEILKSRASVEQDSKGTFDVVTQQYRNDERTFKDFNEAATAFHEAVEKRIGAESDVALARIALEEIVGARWDEINHPQKDK